MAEIVNLRMARKRKARSEKERTAEQNRLLHGRSKAEKLQAETEAGKTRQPRRTGVIPARVRSDFAPGIT